MYRILSFVDVYLGFMVANIRLPSNVIWLHVRFNFDKIYLKQVCKEGILIIFVYFWK
jgi:hypothetical protein